MYIVKLDEANDRDEFGFKASALASLKKAGMPVNPGFVITSRAMETFMARNGLGEKIRRISEAAENGGNTRGSEKEMGEAFLGAVMPSEIRGDIVSAYENLSVSESVRGREAAAAFDLIKAGRNQELVAVRSSVTRNPDDSFAGVVDSFLNVSGGDELLRHVKLCWASLFFARAAVYMEKKGIGNVRMSVIVQRMSDSEKSGTMLTVFGKDKMLVESSWGLGNSVSSGIVTPDEYLLERNGNLLEKNISKKMWMNSRNEMSGRTERLAVPGSRMDVQVLSDTELKKLWELAVKLQGALPGQQLVDWCIGRNRIYILDAKPGNYQITPGSGEFAPGDVAVTGRYVSGGSVTGTVRRLSGAPGTQLGPETIAVSKESGSADVLSAAAAGGFIADEGGRLCNGSVLARELRMPALTATQNATSLLMEGGRVQLAAEQGKVISLPDTGQSDIEIPAFEPPVPEMQEVQEQEAPAEIMPDFEDIGIETGEFQRARSGPEPEAAENLPDENHGNSFPFPSAAGLYQQPAAEEEGISAPEDAAREMPERPVIATRLFVRTGPDMAGKVGGIDGVIVHQGASSPEMLLQAAGEAQAPQDLPVWFASAGGEDFTSAVSMARRAQDSGKSAGMLISVARGAADIERFRYQLPAGTKLGVSIKTPAMALSAPAFMKEGVDMVNIELAPLVQLTMGLKKPDQKMHPAVLGMIDSLREECRSKEAVSCITVGPDYLTDENIELFVRRGVDVLCVDPGSVERVKDALSRIEKKILLESRMSREPAGHDQPDEEGMTDITSSAFSLP